jgi:hypothetical protein
VNPRALAEILKDDLSSKDLLEDMREYPDLYYSDHVAVSREKGKLPLSEPGWRQACLSG